MEYRRAKTPGATYFFTVVTYNRQKILCKPENVDLLRKAFRYVMEKHPFKIDAIVILPDHLHILIALEMEVTNILLLTAPKIHQSSA
ncbi:transposase [Okeania sp. SIO3I5]|uniref:REP-associated tyrosine transposase n=1 Tax=Okeania sp. SIO3I5 TaxID=2607805 RepID=UPI0025FE6B8D|nr:transposase [Okeania sp. SIO3I5]